MLHALNLLREPDDQLTLSDLSWNEHLKGKPREFKLLKLKVPEMNTD